MPNKPVDPVARLKQMLAKTRKRNRNLKARLDKAKGLPVSVVTADAVRRHEATSKHPYALIVLEKAKKDIEEAIREAA